MVAVVSPRPRGLILVLALLLARGTAVEGHGFLATPRSRNFVANEDGKWWAPPGEVHPKPESCPHCLNRGGVAAGACGIVDGYDYTSPLDSLGAPYTGAVQGAYAEGGLFDIEFVLTAHHKGHVELSLCADSASPTNECFDAHKAEFVEDLKYGAPPDPAHPERGYVAPNDGSVPADYSNAVPTSEGGGMHFKMRYRLPAGVSGERVLLRWHYVTGNSCSDVGYDSYAFPSPSWWSPQVAQCGPLDVTGNSGGEQFWNCADIRITQGESAACNTAGAAAAAARWRRRRRCCRDCPLSFGCT